MTQVVDEEKLTDVESSTRHDPPSDGGEAALVSPNSYYKSKVLNVNHGINTLVIASSPIFSIIHQCQQLDSNTDLAQLHRELVHEIQAFECRAQKGTYQEKTILAARFGLCAFIDERIGLALGENKNMWQSYLMLKRFHGKKWGGEQFYILLERSCADPEGYIDLLELFYLCLSLGFQGKYSSMDHGFIIRENIVNRLYDVIRGQRGEVSNRVLISNDNAVPTVTPIKKASLGLFAISLLSIFTILLIIVTQYYSMQDANDSIEQSMSNLLQPQITLTHESPLTDAR